MFRLVDWKWEWEESRDSKKARLQQLETELEVQRMEWKEFTWNWEPNPDEKVRPEYVEWGEEDAVLEYERDRVQAEVHSNIQVNTWNEVQKKVENWEYSKGLTRWELMLLQHFSDLTQPVQDFLENNPNVTESYVSKWKTWFSFSYNGTPFNIALVWTTEYRINTDWLRVHRENIIPFIGIADWFASQWEMDPTNVDISNPIDSPLLRDIIKDNFKVSELFDGSEDFCKVTCSVIDWKLRLRCYTKLYLHCVVDIVF